jgi:hypothetical protein
MLRGVALGGICLKRNANAFQRRAIQGDRS